MILGIIPLGLEQYLADIFVNGSNEGSFEQKSDGEYHVSIDTVNEKTSITFRSGWGSSHDWDDSGTVPRAIGKPVDIDPLPEDVNYEIKASSQVLEGGTYLRVYENGNEVYNAELSQDRVATGSVSKGGSLMAEAASESDPNAGVGGYWELTFSWPEQASVDIGGINQIEL